MCGRFTLVRIDEFIKDLPWVSPPDELPPPRYNIAPTQAVAVVPNTPEHRIEFHHWGLIPSWARDPLIGARMINARSESLADKPAFRRALERRRCLVPADGFFEWRKDADGRKTPLFIKLKNGRPLAMAGLWEVWESPEGSQVRSCAIVTTRANELLKPVHDRMPVILPPPQCEQWVAPGERKPAELLNLLQSLPAEQMECYEVSRLVNSGKVDSPECIKPVKPAGPAAAAPVAASPRPGLFG